MKARIHPAAPVALVWNFTPETSGWPALAAACKEAGLELRQVGSAEAGVNVGRLCGIPGSPDAALLLHLEPDAYPPALILYGLAEPALDRLLAALRGGGVRQPLKAVVNPTNQKWPLCELLAELTAERQALEKPGS